MSVLQLGLLLDVARVSAGLNVLLLLALGYVWLRAYEQVRSNQTLGMLVFTAFLLAENVLALYYYFSGLSVSLPAMQAMMILSLLETLGLAFLAWVTYS